MFKLFQIILGLSWTVHWTRGQVLGKDFQLEVKLKCIICPTAFVCENWYCI